MIECLRVNINSQDPDFQIYPDSAFMKFPFLWILSLHFTLSFNNINASFGNNILYLNDLGSSSITLIDGCYDVEDIN